MLKRTLCIMMAVMLCAAMLPLSVAAKQAEITATNFNTSRGAGDLVVYTDAYGDATDTNYWGVEVIVGADGIVSEIATFKSAIPEGGMVLSGHDDEATGKMMKTWLLENVAVGDHVYFDQRTWRLIVSDATLDNPFPVFYEVSQTFHGVNDSRDADTMIIYTPVKGATTQTNAYGYEVTVTNGVVTAVGGNNSAIPADGYVVSGHGAMKDWLRSSVIIGMGVSYDKDTDLITFSYDADSLKAATDVAFAQTEQAIADAKSAYVYADYSPAENLLVAAQTAYDLSVSDYENGGSDQTFVNDVQSVITMLEEIRDGLCDSRTVQYRGVWVRPSQQSAAEVDAYVKKLHDAGVNAVSVEGWFDSGVIMELPEDSLFERNLSFNYDVLQAYIDACHSYGMECHLWMPVLNVGDLGRYEDRSIVTKNPEWLALNNEGGKESQTGFLFVDPANIEARDYLVEFYRYLVTTYDIDCFELDYIRYNKTGDYDFGYTQAAFDGFEAEYGYGVTPEYDPEADYWEDWVQYRCDRVTDVVVVVREMLDESAPDVLLSASVDVDPEDTRYTTRQDFGKWLDMGLLDILHNMAYGDGYRDTLASNTERAGERTMTVPGLGVYVDSLNAPEMESQAIDDNEIGAYGEFYFEAAAYLSDRVYDTSVNSVYRNEAIAPFIDPDASIVESLRYMQGRIDDVLVPLQGVTEAEAQSLTEAINAAIDSVADAAIDETALTALKTVIDALADEQAKTVLNDDLLHAERISNIVNAADYVAQPSDDTAQTTTTAATASAEKSTDSTTTLVIVVVVIVGIIGGAFGTWKVVMMKKQK